MHSNYQKTEKDLERQATHRKQTKEIRSVTKFKSKQTIIRRAQKLQDHDRDSEYKETTTIKVEIRSARNLKKHEETQRATKFKEDGEDAERKETQRNWRRRRAQGHVMENAQIRNAKQLQEPYTDSE